MRRSEHGWRTAHGDEAASGRLRLGDLLAARHVSVLPAVAGAAALLQGALEWASLLFLLAYLVSFVVAAIEGGRSR